MNNTALYFNEITTLIANPITILLFLCFLYQNRRKIAPILKKFLKKTEPVIFKLNVIIDPHKPTIRLAWKAGLELMYIGCIAIGVIFFLQYKFGLISFNEAWHAAASFLGLGLYMRYAFRNLY
jgi:uncharacterized protein (DUF2062 family)